MTVIIIVKRRGRNGRHPRAGVQSRVGIPEHQDQEGQQQRPLRESNDDPPVQVQDQDHKSNEADVSRRHLL